ncbi:MAG: LacI family DNA-binding transcriptional regulator [Spirochaetales bacterium]|nr:LacI family DNA-binding transcriptional regulator [Spirochaetales bacterium]
MKRVTQEDIAKKLNITRTTVARALNNKGYVEADLKAKILKTATEMGYKANQGARSLAKKNGWHVHCFLASYNEEFAEQLESGLKAVARDYSHYGFSISVYSHKPDNPGQQVSKLREIMAGEKVDGLILSPMLKNEINEILDKYVPENVPVSSLNLKVDHSKNLFYVGSDSNAGGALAAELMAMLMGQKGKIAVFNTFNEFEALKCRYTGFMNKMKEFQNIKIVENLYLDNIEDSEAEAIRILDEHKDLTGMYTNTEITYLSRAIERRNRENIKLVGNGLDNEIMALISRGYVDMAVHSRPYFQGYLVGKYMFNYILNGVVPENKNTFVGFDIATKSNLEVDDSFRILTSGE